jgi:hypothetical protein
MSTAYGHGLFYENNGCFFGRKYALIAPRFLLFAKMRFEGERNGRSCVANKRFVKIFRKK